MQEDIHPRVIKLLLEEGGETYLNAIDSLILAVTKRFEEWIVTNNQLSR